MRLLRVFLPIIATLLVATAEAGPDKTAYIHELQRAASDKALWQDREWLNLGHYRQAKVLRDDYSSAVDDNRFFYASTGNTSPQEELNATLAAFFSEQETGNEHALCRSPARFNWLNLHLDIDAGGEIGDDRDQVLHPSPVESRRRREGRHVQAPAIEELGHAHP